MFGKWAVYAVVLLLLLAVLLVWRSPGEAPVGYELGTPAELASIARIERALDKQVSLQLHDLPLDQAVRKLAAQSGIEILLDHKALEDAGFPEDSQVSLEASGVKLRRALDRLLQPLELAWVLENEALVVTSNEKAGNALTTFVYPVYDLASPSQPGGGKNAEQLSSLIQVTIQSPSWGNHGGPGSIHAHAASGTLVVSQTRPVHAQIRELLTALRAARDGQDANLVPSSQGKPAGQVRPPLPAVPAPPAPPATPPAGAVPVPAAGAVPVQPAPNQAAPVQPSPPGGAAPVNLAPNSAR